jgi:hypothetical protein
MGLLIYTVIHVVISLVGIGSGFVVLFGLIAANRPDRWTAVFLATTLATSVTGFFFPFHGFTPAYAFGVLSLVVLALAIYALHIRRLAGAWRKTYVINALIALYLNTFVLIVQLFQKVPALRAIAPTQSEPPFAIAQTVLLLLFLLLGIAATIRFREVPTGAAE